MSIDVHTSHEHKNKYRKKKNEKEKRKKKNKLRKLQLIQMRSSQLACIKFEIWNFMLNIAEHLKQMDGMGGGGVRNWKEFQHVNYGF